MGAQATYIRLESSLYKLAMYLPHKVDGEKGSAKWDKKKETLSITLPIIRQDLVRVAALPRNPKSRLALM